MAKMRGKDQPLVTTQDAIFHTNLLMKSWSNGDWWATKVRCKTCTKKYGRSMFLSSNGKTLACPRCGHKEEVKK